MKNSQKGPTVPWVIAIIAVLAIGGGVYVYNKSEKKAELNTTITAVIDKQTDTTSNAQLSTSIGEINEDSENKSEFKGYYTNITQNFYNEIKVCDSFVVTDGDSRLVTYFKNMVNEGNTVNQINTDGNLVIHLNLSETDSQGAIKIKNSSKSDPVIIEFQKNIQAGKDAGNCHSFFKILKVR